MDEFIHLLHDMVIECDPKIIDEETLLQGILRALPQVNLSKGIDEHSKIAITWAGWALGGDVPTGRVDPLMIDKDGKSIDLDPLAPANSKFGERPPIPERSLHPAAPQSLLLLACVLSIVFSLGLLHEGVA